MIRIFVTNTWSRISGLTDVEIIDSLDDQLSFFIEGYQYMKAFKQGWFDKKTNQWRYWDGKRHLLGQKMVFPTGLLSRVKRFFLNHNIEYEICDLRKPVESGEKINIIGKTPWPHQLEAVEAALKNERGIIRVGTGGGKSPRIGTKVLKFDGTICKVEELKAGDLLMGPDSKPRTVLSTNIQYGNICKITPVKGEPWYCNDEHILTLKHTVTNKIIDINLQDYKNKSKKFKHLYKQFSVGVEFDNNVSLPVDPYFLGIFFGDGDKQIIKGKLNHISITTADHEMVNYVELFARHHSKYVNIYKDKRSRALRCRIGGFIKEKKLLEDFRDLLGPELKVPYIYLTSSRENRLQFLAGWIDTDGYLHNNSYEIVQKRKDWADAITFLARSLGFRVLVSIKYDKKYNTNYYRMSISGNVSEIPVKIERKKAQKRTQKKNVNKTGFKVEPAGQDYFVGIELDGDGRFLLGDFIVTHNTLVASLLTAEYNVPTMIYVVGKDLLYQFHKEMKKTIGEEQVGIIGDGHCDVKKFNVCSVWTAITAFGLKTHVSLDDEDWAPEIVSIGPKNKRIIQNAIENTQLAIFDEAHFLACETIQAIFKASKNCRYMFGMTGTDWRDDGADLLLEASCGERIYNMPSSKLIEQGYLVQPKIALVEVPRLEKNCPNNFSSVYSNYITNNDTRNQIIVEGAKNLIKMGRKVLILVRYIHHGKKIVDMLQDLPVFFVNGKIEGHIRQEVKEKFEKGELSCLVASSVFDIGVDIPCMDALILAGGGKSTVRVLQRIGRVIRSFPNKKDAIVMDFIDNAKYLDIHSATRIAVYETEPMFKIKFPKDFNRDSIKKIKKIKTKIK